jgi:Flp pilus assembly protein TadD
VDHTRTTARPSRARILLSVALIGLGGCRSYVDRHVAQGDSLFKARQFREAIDQYGKALRFSPNNPSGIRGIGLAHYYVRDARDAFIYLSKADVLQPGIAEVNVALGNIYLGNGRADSALKFANSVLNKDPGNIAALRLQGTAYLATPEPTKAADAYRKILRSDPRDSLAHYYLGLSLLSQQKRDEAKREFETALAVSPKWADALARIVEIGFADHRGDEALAAAKQHIAAVGKSAQLMRVLGDAYVAKGDVGGAEAAYREAMAIDPKFVESRIALAGVYFSSKKEDDALRLLDEAIKIDSLSVPAFVLRGMIFQSRRDDAQAQTAYEKALSLNPRQAKAANNLALLLLDKPYGEKRAIELASVAYDAAPHDPHIADTFGWILYRRGMHQRAVDLLRQSAEKLPSDPAIQYHLGMALQQVGDVGGARRALTQAMSSPTVFAGKEEARRTLAALK